MRQPHQHADVISAWARGAIVQQRFPGGEWEDLPDDLPPSWAASIQDRIKPGDRYPRSTLAGTQLKAVFDAAVGNEHQKLTAVANAALRHAIDTRQVEEAR